MSQVLQKGNVVYHIGMCAMIHNILTFLIENQSFIEKFEENEAEIHRIETITLRGVAQQCLLFSMPLAVLVYPIQADENLLGFFLCKTAWT